MEKNINSTHLLLRNDDVFMATAITNKMGYATRIKSFYQWFLDTDTIFEKYQYPCILACLTEGIDKNPEWVEYVKKNLHRFQIELHGSSHYFYNSMSEEEGYEDLKKAKEKLENAFDRKITTWYVPFGERKFPEWGKRVCNKLNLDFDVTAGNKGKQIYFHYWAWRDIEKITNLLHSICRQRESN